MCIIMSPLRDFSIPEAYNQISSMVALAKLEPMVDWNSLASMVSVLFKNNTEEGGRPPLKVKSDGSGQSSPPPGVPML